MTEAVFFEKDDLIVGFQILGHSSDSADDIEGKTVCAAVSSAAFMTANTMSEIIGVPLEAEVDDAVMKIGITSGADKCQVLLRGFKLHLTELAKEYPNRLKISTLNSEV